MIKIDYDVIGMCATNCYYVTNEETRQIIVVDPAGDYERIKDRIIRSGCDLAGILLTHGHFDHILAVNKLKSQYDVKVYAYEGEEEVLLDARLNLSSAMVGTPVTVKADVFLYDGQKFELGGYNIEVLHVPGHTQGGACYYFEDEGIVFTGDTLFSGSIGRSDFPTGNGRQLVDSIQSKLMVLPDETKVYSGHGEITSIGSEKKYNPYFD